MTPRGCYPSSVDYEAKIMLCAAAFSLCLLIALIASSDSGDEP